MYQSTKVITIAGSGFNPDGTKFRFGNTLLEGANYTADVTPESATFSLEEGSKWRLVRDGQGERDGGGGIQREEGERERER